MQIPERIKRPRCVTVNPKQKVLYQPQCLALLNIHYIPQYQIALKKYQETKRLVEEGHGESLTELKFPLFCKLAQ